MTRTPQGVIVHFTNGDVVVRKELVQEACCSKGDPASDEKLPADAAEKTAQGFVRFEGKWLKKEQRDRVLDDRRKARAKRIKDAMDHREWRNRYKSQTESFEFESTIDPEILKGLAPLMETYYKTFLREWRISKPAGLGRAKVCFYHDRDTYLQVSGSPVRWAGYFRPGGAGELNFYYDRNDPEETVLVMLHETNHYLTYLIDPEFHYPIWINESLAEYYGASRWDPDARKMTLGCLQEGRLAAIQDHILAGRWQRLEDLFRTEQAAFTADHYAWGWSFVHFLLESRKYAPKFKAFYLALARDKTVRTKKTALGSRAVRTVDPDEVIRVLLQHLGVKDLAALETEWHDWVKGLAPTSGRGYSQAAFLYESLGMPIKARRFYETALAAGDQRPAVHFGLARVLHEKLDYEGADKALKKAIEGDPLNGLYYAALALNVEKRLSDPTGAEAGRLRLLALEVDPENLQLVQELATLDVVRKAIEDALSGKPDSRP
jgi:tetratricopeptide (TPR) repeat protein